MNENRLAPDQNVALLRALIILFFLCPFLGWMIGVLHWHFLGPLPPYLDYSQKIALFAFNYRLIELRSGSLDLGRIRTISELLLLGIALQSMIGVALAIRAFVMRAVLRVPGYRLPSFAHFIVIFFATWFMAWILFVSPMDTADNGKLGQAAATTDFRFVVYIATFTAFNALMAFNVSAVLQFIRWMFRFTNLRSPS